MTTKDQETRVDHSQYDQPLATASTVVAGSDHTPGPWEFEAGIHSDPDFEDCDFIIAEAHERGEVVCTVIGPIRLGTSEANARLIAAAPDLLAACKAAYIALPMAKHNQETNAMLSAALAKAEGR